MQTLSEAFMHVVISFPSRTHHSSTGAYQHAWGAVPDAVLLSFHRYFSLHDGPLIAACSVAERAHTTWLSLY